VMVFTSAKKETDPNSIRMRMFREMSNANYDVHMMETVGQGEKCVDIQLAVEMLHYATVPNAYDVAILLTGDKDFVPALVRTRQKGKQVVICSMKTGCNRVLYESPHIRDYNVVWLEDCLDELIVPIPEEERSRRDRGGYASVFTMMRIIRDFVESAPEDFVSSRDIGKYLKSVEIADSNMLEELKQSHGGLRTFLMERARNLFDVQFPPAGVNHGRDDHSFWVSVKGDSDDTLVSEFKRTQFFTKEEKEFLEDYKRDKFVTKDSYSHTTMADLDDLDLEESETDSTNDNDSPPVIDYSDLTVASLKDMCRDRNLPVSGKKDALIQRLEEDRELELSIIKRQRQDARDATTKIPRNKIMPSTRGVAPHVISRRPGPKPSSPMMDGNVYASALPQMKIESTRNSRNARTSTDVSIDSVVTDHLERTVEEYLKASGGVAGSRDIGRYLAANSDSRKSNVSALTELKETYGSLVAFLRSRKESFQVEDDVTTENGFLVKLLKPRR
jgi:hypothetical protein